MRMEQQVLTPLVPHYGPLRGREREQKGRGGHRMERKTKIRRKMWTQKERREGRYRKTVRGLRHACDGFLPRPLGELWGRRL